MSHPPGTSEPLVVRELPDVAVVQVHANVDARMAAALRAALTKAVDRRGNVVLDLAGAPGIDPTGLGLLVRAHRRARQRGQAVCVVAPSRYVVTVLHTMRLDRAFPIFADCPAALQWLRQDHRDDR